MHLPKLNKLMLMFLSPRNPLFGRMIQLERGRTEREITWGDVEHYVDIKQQTHRNWAAGGTVSPLTVMRIFKTAREVFDEGVSYRRRSKPFDEEEYRQIRTTIDRFETALKDDDFDVYGVASILGLDAVKCQSIIDGVINDRFPLLLAAYYPPKPRDPAEKDFAQAEMDRFEGTYLLWMKRSKALTKEGAGEDTVLLQCALGIRYLQDLGGGRYIRCKLHVPTETATFGAKVSETAVGRVRYFEYDGFPVIRGSRIYWIFEKRQTQQPDCIFFITDVDPRMNPQHMAMRGCYLATAQDSKQLVVTGEMLTQRVLSHGYGGTQLSYRDLMLNSLKVRPGVDSPMVTAQWEQARHTDRERGSWGGDAA